MCRFRNKPGPVWLLPLFHSFPIITAPAVRRVGSPPSLTMMSSDDAKQVMAVPMNEEDSEWIDKEATQKAREKCSAGDT